MTVLSGAKSLELRLEIANEVHEFVLKDGESLVVGRDKDCQVVLSDDSISHRHLELRWHNKKIEIRDLESSNGTFRMPQDAPFVEAKIDVLQQMLDLRLAKIPMKLSWIVADAGPQVKDFSKGKSTLKQSLKARMRGGSEFDSKNSELSEARRSELLSALRKKLFLYFSLSSFVLIVFLNAADFSPLLRLGPKAIKLGVGFDLLEMIFQKKGQWFGVVISMAVLFAFIHLKFSHRLKESAGNQNDKVMVFCGWAFLLLPLIFPLGILLMMGNPSQKFSEYNRLKEVESIVFSHDYSSREENLRVSKILRDSDKIFFGSSIFYSLLYNFQKKRAVHECEGLGESAWSKKRFCLVLLYALSVESYAVVRPLYLYQTSATLVLLSSLDGIVRVLAAEGPDSQYLELFLKSLDKVGLDKELVTLQKFVKSFKGKSFDELMKALLELRLELEKRVTKLQMENSFPKKYALDLRGPLEMGI